MLATIELTEKQAARILEQALRTQARVVLESRPREGPLAATIVRRQGQNLCLALQSHSPAASLPGLIGAFCEVRMVLSGHLYLFSTCVVDAKEVEGVQELHLAPPTAIELANRRRFDRRGLRGLVEVQLWIPTSTTPCGGLLNNISRGGINCRFAREPLEDLLLIDEEVRVCFELPLEGETFVLPALVVVKTPMRDGVHLDVGLEFTSPEDDEPVRRSLERLRAALARGYTGNAQTENE